MKRKNGLARGFTLIELLVVIVIIGMLAAILIPSVLGAFNSAKRTRAMGQIRDLDGAIKRYYAEYGRMPVPAGDNGGDDKEYTGTEQAQVVEILINNTLNTNANPRQIVFLDLSPESFGVKSLVEMQNALRSGNPYKDPWGREYGLLMDLNFDDKISNLGPGEIRAKTAVYSLGDPQKGYDVNTTPFKTW